MFIEGLALLIFGLLGFSAYIALLPARWRVMRERTEAFERLALVLSPDEERAALKEGK